MRPESPAPPPVLVPVAAQRIEAPELADPSGLMTRGLTAGSSPGAQPARGRIRRLERYHLLVVDEIAYQPLERQAANLLFALVSRR